MSAAAVQAQFNFQTKSKAKPRTKTKPVAAPKFTPLERERVLNHLISNGWREAWVSDQVIQDVLRLEREGRRK
jgi:hypothetical protein